MKKAVFVGLALIPAIALATTGDKQDKKRDGLICRESVETGSRLSTKRVCMSREEWEASRREARQVIERAQTQQWNPKGN
jgi:hypothetical protein